MRLLLVEDDPMIGETVLDLLRAEHYAVDWVRDGDMADTALRDHAYDLVVLDLGLPRRDGLSVLRTLRARLDRTPVLIATARDAKPDRIAGLDAGADDYVLKPYDLDELLARIRALTRRARAERASTACHCGDLAIDFAAHRVTRAGEPVRLTPIEFRVLALLASHPGKVLTYRQLLSEAWGSAASDQHHYVRIVVGHLRRKLEAEPARPRHLITETGVGYRWQP